MTSWRRWQFLRQGRVPEAFSSSVRVALALVGIMAWCLSRDEAFAIISLMLGVIASALAETDDNWRGRLRGQLTTLLCFGLVILAVKTSLAHPASLMGVIVVAAFLLTLLGALGERYRTVATATLIMALYAALATQPSASRPLVHGQEILLLWGAAWYGLISVAWTALLPRLAVEQNLSQLYEVLGRYLELKSRMFEPVRGIDLEQRRLALALHNGRVVDALNACKESLFSRMNPSQAPDWLVAALHSFFVAQDVHERTSSSHEAYELLANTFFHSDVLYRCQRVVALLGKDCLSLAQAIRKREKWIRAGGSARAIGELRDAIAYVEADVETEVEAASAPVPDDAGRRARRSLRALASNLGAMDQEIFALQGNETLRLPAELTLQDSAPRTVGQFRDRLLAQLSINSLLMRHAIRLSVALMAGYALMVATGDSYGFWILLTIVFVCQPKYGVTLTRLIERIAGTVLGLLVGWALLRLFPDPLEQSAFVIVAAVLFFAFRATRYTLATAGITAFVLLAFNQVGDGYGLIVPRLLDTLAGSAIAGISIWLVLPSWYSLRLPRLAAEALRAQSRYFSQIMAQYAVAEKNDSLAYRIARRDAHNADAALSGALEAALKEPGYVRRNLASATRFLVLSHTLLNYLSALGAHRTAQQAPVDELRVAAAGLNAALEAVAQALDAGHAPPESAPPDETGALPGLDSPAGSDIQRVLRAQLALALRLLPSLRAAAGALVSRSG